MTTTEKIPNYILEELLNQASKSTMRTKHGCVIVKGKHIISSGSNNELYHSESNAILQHMCKNFITLNYKKNIQRLIYIINKNNDIIKKLKGSCLYVLRVDKNGELSNSKPCVWCTELIKNIHFKKIIYTTGINIPWNIERPSKLITSHVSIGVTNFLNYEDY